jgi:hypothetical protein
VAGPRKLETVESTGCSDLPNDWATDCMAEPLLPVVPMGRGATSHGSTIERVKGVTPCWGAPAPSASSPGDRAVAGRAPRRACALQRIAVEVSAPGTKRTARRFPVSAGPLARSCCGRRRRPRASRLRRDRPWAPRRKRRRCQQLLATRTPEAGRAHRLSLADDQGSICPSSVRLRFPPCKRCYQFRGFRREENRAETISQHHAQAPLERHR